MPNFKELDISSMSRIVEMAWADEVTFESIELQYGLKEKQVIQLMRRHLKRSSFKLWRSRVYGRVSKHFKKSKLKKISIENY